MRIPSLVALLVLLAPNAWSEPVSFEEIDGPGINRTTWVVTFATKSAPGGRRFCREAETVFGRTDHQYFEAGRAWDPDFELCRIHGVSEQSYYRWKKIYGGMEPSQARELKQLREENTKLKRLVADLSLDKAMLQDVLQKKL